MKILKIAVFAITLLTLLCIFQPKSYGAQVQSFDEMRNSIQAFLNQGKNSNLKIGANDMKSVITPIANILTAIGVVVLIAVVSIMGLKYMFATPEEAAKLKQQLIGVVVSGVVIFGAVAIWRIVYTLLDKSGL